MTPRALVLRALGLGDLLTTVPAIRAIRRGLPGHHLVLAAPGSFADLLVSPDLCDEVLPTSELHPIDWQRPAPDVAVDLHGCGPQSHRLLQALGPGRLVAFDCAEAGVSGPPWWAGEHEVRRWCRLVEHAGWAADPKDLYLPRPPAVETFGDVVVVHPGAAHASRRWPGERFAAVAAWLQGQGHDVVVTGSVDEAAVATDVARLAGLPDDSVLAGSTDLRRLSALVADARLVVSGDTGLAHLASAHRTPSVVLFGPVPPAEWGPPDGPHTVLWHGAEGGPPRRGDPFGAATDEALLAITVEEVIEAARDRLQHGEARGIAPTLALPAATADEGAGRR